LFKGRGVAKVAGLGVFWMSLGVELTHEPRARTPAVKRS
jgi:hypothetical protein